MRLVLGHVNISARTALLSFRSSNWLSAAGAELVLSRRVWACTSVLTIVNLKIGSQ
jgi:hypothetical protein